MRAEGTNGEGAGASSHDVIRFMLGADDLYFDVVEHVAPIYRDAKVRRFAVRGLTYDFDAGVPEGRHLQCTLVAGDRLWLTSPQMVTQARRLVAWMREHPDCDIEVETPGMLQALLGEAFGRPTIIDGLWKRVGGLLWPASDRVSAALLLAECGLINWPAVLAGVGRRVAVQAGGNVGLWPVKLAGYFDVVHTFEPDGLLVQACRLNTAGHHNVHVHALGLGQSFERLDLHRDPQNSGSGRRVEGGPGALPVVPLDDYLTPDHLDLIWLDTNGTEVEVLRGARDLIQRFHPVIIAEDGDIHDRAGLAKGSVRAFLEPLGYHPVATIAGDTRFQWTGR